MSDVYYPMDHTPAEWRAMAKGREQEKQDSFDRCDTDGFLSQWASGCMAGVYSACARAAENNGRAELAWVLNENDEPVEWKWVETRYGSSVLIFTGEGHGKNVFWNPSEHRKGAERLKRDRAKGFHWGTVECEVVVDLVGANATSVHAVTLRKKDAELTVTAPVDRRYDRDHS